MSRSNNGFACAKSVGFSADSRLQSMSRNAQAVAGARQLIRQPLGIALPIERNSPLSLEIGLGALDPATLIGRRMIFLV